MSFLPILLNHELYLGRNFMTRLHSPTFKEAWQAVWSHRIVFAKAAATRSYTSHEK